VLLAPRHPIRHRAEIPSLETREALLSRSDQAGHLGKQTGREKAGPPDESRTHSDAAYSPQHPGSDSVSDYRVYRDLAI